MPGMPIEITLALTLFFGKRVKMNGGKVRTLLDFFSSLLVVEISQKSSSHAKKAQKKR